MDRCVLEESPSPSPVFSTSPPPPNKLSVQLLSPIALLFALSVQLLSPMALLFALLLCGIHPGLGQRVTTIAGGGRGYGDATGTLATFNNPDGVAVDSGGNVYVADTSNNRIRKVSPGGVVSTLAGSGTAALANGAGTLASFYSPRDIALDSVLNVYVVDTSNNCVRKITPAGVVTTFAGSGTAGSSDGTGTLATFNKPFGIATNSGDTLYIADSSNNKLRKVTPGGVVTVFAGSGTASHVDATGTSAAFYSPYGVTVDTSGKVYVGDTKGHYIRLVTPAGVVTTLAGSGTSGFVDGTGTNAKFNLPSGLAVTTGGIVFVADYSNNCIRAITSAGVVTTLAGSSTSGSNDGVGTLASFYSPVHVALDSSGVIYVGDYSNCLIRKIDCAEGTYISASNPFLCTYCAAGTWSSAGATSCANCAAGTWSSAGASSCANCNSGYFCTSTTQNICSAGSYSDAGASSCTSCAAGKYSTPGASSCTATSPATYAVSTFQFNCEYLCTCGAVPYPLFFASSPL